ncbi:hypothetical protein Taro_022972 [Colocasia esculenta]|uniref:Uncharacterized protein n=1 Tax=Colocasia esculenta TaxID=4460 RepID=A0A843VD13_COLES|nr:hypothetical protein [Colocasia esculenta]
MRRVARLGDPMVWYRRGNKTLCVLLLCFLLIIGPSLLVKTCYLGRKHLVDVTEIFSLLSEEKKSRLIKLAFYVSMFIIIIYSATSGYGHPAERERTGTCSGAVLPLAMVILQKEKGQAPAAVVVVGTQNGNWLEPVLGTETGIRTTTCRARNWLVMTAVVALMDEDDGPLDSGIF